MKQVLIFILKLTVVISFFALMYDVLSRFEFKTLDLLVTVIMGTMLVTVLEK